MRFKKYIKGIFEKYPNYSEKDIINKIKNYNYISFDVFDTLIKRYELAPVDIFRATAHRYNALFKNNQIDESEFVNKRIDAEKKCRILCEREEIRFDDIYCEIRKIYGNISDVLKEIELNLEIEECYANPVFKNIYKWCLENNKQIIITSDMYLSQKHIEEILHSSGYDNYSYIFVSSELGITKKSGRLFKKILRELNITSDMLIHLGDNIVSDYFVPYKLGIKSVKIATYPDRTLYFRARHLRKNDMKKYSDLKKYVSGIISTEWSEYYRFGFEILGPLVFCFCKWLKLQTDKNASHFFFLSRDGYLLKKAYLEMFPEDSARVDYLYVSRKSLRLPNVFVSNDLETVMSTFRPFSYLNYRDICYGLCIDEEFAKQSWLEAGLGDNEVILAKEFHKNNKGKYFYELVKEEILKTSEIEYKKVIEYLKQKKFQGDVCIIDIGWAGTLQRCLQRMIKKIDKKVDIKGFYLGMSSEEAEDIKAKGFIPVSKEPWSLCVGIVEYGFPALEGTTKKYNANYLGEIVPELLEYEYEDNSLEKSVVKDIQNGVLGFINAIKKSSCFELDFGAETAYSNLEAFSKRPRLRDVELFGDLRFHDQEVTQLAKPNSLIAYLVNPRRIITDLNKSTWKIGFLKRLFRIDLPYYMIMTFLKKII